MNRTFIGKANLLHVHKSWRLDFCFGFHVFLFRIVNPQLSIDSSQRAPMLKVLANVYGK